MEMATTIFLFDFLASGREEAAGSGVYGGDSYTIQCKKGQ